MHAPDEGNRHLAFSCGVGSCYVMPTLGDGGNEALCGGKIRRTSEAKKLSRRSMVVTVLCSVRH